MKRRTAVILIFLLFAAGVAWYASLNARAPEISFEQAAQVGDSKKKVLVSGRLLDRDIVPEGKSLTFYMVDNLGNESKIFYDGEEEIPHQMLADARKAGRSISVAGHTCGDRFHTSMITLR